MGGLALFDRERAQIEAAYAWLDAEVGRGVLTAPPDGRAAPPRGRGNEVGDASASSRRAEDSPPHLAAARQMLALVNAVAYTSNLRFHPRQRIAWPESQLRAARLVKDRKNEGNALGNLGSAHAALGDARKAIEFYEQYLAITREIGDRRGEGNALFNSAHAHNSLGNRREAIARAAAALAIFAAIEDPNAAMVCAQLAQWRG